MKLYLHDTVQEADGIVTYRFQPEQPVEYTAGQFIELSLPHEHADDRGTRRWFTLSSSPTEPYLAITMRVSNTQSSFKHALQRMEHGQPANMTDLLGDFVLPLSAQVPLVWIAGGIGITPFRSMAQWLVDTGEQREITLFHSLRKPDEALFADIFADAHIVEHRVIEPTDTTSRIQQKLAVSANDTSTLYFLSGPEAMTKALSQHLHEQGISGQQIVVDAFLGY